jgi:hypothetical protein
MYLRVARQCGNTTAHQIWHYDGCQHKDIAILGKINLWDQPIPTLVHMYLELSRKMYGFWDSFVPKMLWVMGYEGGMGYVCKSPHTNLGIRKSYGVLESMGYQGYGLGGC